MALVPGTAGHGGGPGRGHRQLAADGGAWALKLAQEDESAVLCKVTGDGNVQKDLIKGLAPKILGQPGMSLKPF